MTQRDAARATRAASADGGGDPPSPLTTVRAPHPRAGAGRCAAGGLSLEQTAPASGNARRRLSDEEFVRAIRPLFDAGKSWREIGDLCGVTASAARARAATAGMRIKSKAPAPKNWPRVHDDESVACMAALANARGHKHAAHAYNISVSTVRVVLWKHGYRKQWVRV